MCAFAAAAAGCAPSARAKAAQAYLLSSRVPRVGITCRLSEHVEPGVPEQPSQGPPVLDAEGRERDAQASSHPVHSRENAPAPRHVLRDPSASFWDCARAPLVGSTRDGLPQNLHNLRNLHLVDAGTLARQKIARASSIIASRGPKHFNQAARMRSRTLDGLRDPRARPARRRAKVAATRHAGLRGQRDYIRKKKAQPREVGEQRRKAGRITLGPTSSLG
ncbi:uncharacterized protein PHACADRAFT_28691 [Phanerochaete carnosa HHB-10118-sp]|uniref:Uncharacterized protein n=1 Tax=Phanerochaete carnosa (strain HHB-10118-sp) TaxID=650164 RepID=K5VVT7_PHACS|nr:uncharacterized protein PHACADRAFT_28691 [Phanerochaete carnosa HHB-10118-sp]EKM55668.1 hypothetical protein PHACADRAFT_28691 [Phanerochaete carnosa HHB-10118-sp]